jgi:hypothetical protein
VVQVVPVARYIDEQATSESYHADQSCSNDLRAVPGGSQKSDLTDPERNYFGKNWQ